MRRVYLDYAAATPLDPRVKLAMDEYLAGGGANPSGLYQEGRLAKKALEESRQRVAGFVGAKPAEIYFTASTTESNNLAILGAARANRHTGKHLITTAVEHVSVLNPFRQLEREGFEVTYLPVDEYGRVSAERVKSAIRPDTILVSVIFASNEIGTINPIGPIGQTIKELKNQNGLPSRRGTSFPRDLPYFHSDAAQAAPHLKINAANCELDLMSFSAGKMYGPKGAAALYVKRGVRLEPIMHGGSQENGLRPGTQDLAGIVGFAEAIKILKNNQQAEESRLEPWRDRIIKEVQAALPEVLLNGHPRERLANNISFSVPGLSGEELVLALDQAGPIRSGASNGAGFALSTRSACDSHNPTPPHVIKALGRTDEEAWGTVRITLGRYTKEEEVGRFIEAFINIVKKLKSRKH